MISIGRNIPEDFKTDGIDKSYDAIFELICKNIRVEFADGRFVYFIDENYVMDTTKGYRWENLTPDYGKILTGGLYNLKYLEDEVTNDYCISHNNVIDCMLLLVNRIIDEIDRNHPSMTRQRAFFERMKSNPSNGFEESIQRMLFVNQLFWQMDHRLTGLGAWDSLLAPYYAKDVAAGELDRDKAIEIIKDLFVILHNHYEYKSNVLMGDTGQIFVLGRSDGNGGYVFNELTELFIIAMHQTHIPEPKCLLRVNKNTPKRLIEIALDAIASGIGSPLLANDDIVIPALVEFGIPIEDALLWTTSACWEPLIGGKSSSMNNMTVLNYLKAFDNMIRRDRLEKIENIEDLIDRYLFYLRLNLKAVKRVLRIHRHQYDPLLSVFTDDCKILKRDVSCGGARYHNVGITSVALGNLVNSLINIDEYVFKKKEFSLYDVKRMVITDFEGDETFAEKLKRRKSVYGKDDKRYSEIVNRITSCVSKEISDYTSYLGGKMKVGLSGSTYLDSARVFDASFDGRRFGDPFTVHVSNEDNDSYTEIINFVSQLDYSGSRFNGNVVDLMVNPNFILNNREKFVEFIMASIRIGFFQMQMNVVSSKTLIDARRNPELYPNLIVRVWGFSSYFNDLPDEYKDVLIERVIKNERNMGAAKYA